MSTKTEERPSDAPVATEPTATAPEPPYSIFDKKQKWLIIVIVSTAATCKIKPQKFPALPIANNK